ncbi:uncharacterized protein TM35_000062870 [Trypanosoma theileri]|uniref:Uncharacterized protein n=1 Tax=Trypanosoma theileri TaxID=67003 RepID=A0A1X0P2Z4_9TRYP|nr:uncharacterized protein TM35_000062870 [Trypanosoma theileri]ORC91282.1 hypothetical protein TM35_000062870 [Trypanosoma theileri]
MCEPNHTPGQWTSVKEPHTSTPVTHKHVDGYHHAAIQSTPQRPQWSDPATQQCPSHSQCTHTHNDSPTCSYQRGTAAFPKMYTKSHTYREEKKSTRKEKQQGTNSTQSTHNTQ